MNNKSGIFKLQNFKRIYCDVSLPAPVIFSHMVCVNKLITKTKKFQLVFVFCVCGNKDFFVCAATMWGQFKMRNLFFF